MVKSLEAVDTAAAPAGWERQRRARVSGGHLLMAAAGILALVANLAVLRGRDERVPILVAAGDIPVGSVLGAADFRAEEIAADPGVLAALLPASAAQETEGMITTRPIGAGSPLSPRDLRPAAASSERRAMAIPVEPERAVGGAIAIGDRVDIVGVRDGVAGFVLTGAEVIDVSARDTAALGPVTGFYIVVAVDADEALRLALALAEGRIDVVRSTGAPPVAVVGEP
ncbi:MAG: RcpC/CpaB family pilus assembly protein [Acidimicrobiia bacterium]|jgi:Flp pilus assembly protein CpaB